MPAIIAVTFPYETSDLTIKNYLYQLASGKKVFWSREDQKEANCLAEFNLSQEKTFYGVPGKVCVAFPLATADRMKITVPYLINVWRIIKAGV